VQLILRLHLAHLRYLRPQRQICKEYGADVLTTEFVSAEGIFRRNERTREYLDFDDIERPIGVQLFGADAGHMAEAARQVIDWVRPDFIDLNFGCPAKEVTGVLSGNVTFVFFTLPSLLPVTIMLVKPGNMIGPLAPRSLSTWLRAAKLPAMK